MNRRLASNHETLAALASLLMFRIWMAPVDEAIDAGGSRHSMLIGP